ncbi:hypothetical protein CVU83_03360 [Candidatus Falkowbacteria bacterium HGW-Falkowbacteria-2]|uniref:Nudix hydrolase domain-containing protein n=1 Tax=Candidatus Falkowbacteria bacterium HGW-Falkowbacteria-2 TaxID=2013769 RepID=A0A2N2DXK0_9BACT|nr:MAG: hypothetical protein CVU83_03360 [Candidatus Falkowbacteria bacterium HGW-Falkowbacteria-2]
MIHTEKPDIFDPIFEVVSCYVEHDGKILLLHRQDHKSEGDCWGLPAGKVDEGESIAEAVIREVQEETGQKIIEENLNYVGKVYVKYPDYDFIYHIFKTVISEEPIITLSEGEHKAYQWEAPAKAMDLKLVRDLDECIKMTYSI